MKLLSKIFIIITIIFIWNTAIADDTKTETKAHIKLTVTEKVPWYNCVKQKEKNDDWSETETWRRECSVYAWMTAFEEMLWSFIKFFTAVWALTWVLYFVINWIMLSMWWLDSSVKDKTKKNLKWSFIWLVMLLMSWVILNALFPWIYK